jgi:hypothetical protein
METISSYKRKIHILSRNNENTAFMNADNEKALAVFVELFHRAQQRVRLFSGSLLNEEVSNNSQYISALSDFLEKEGVKLEILLNKPDEEKIRNTPLYKRLTYYKNAGTDITIRKTDRKLYFLKSEHERTECHFCVCDNNSFRLEIDIVNRSAICNFNDTTGASILIKKFDEMFNDSEEIFFLDTNS